MNNLRSPLLLGLLVLILVGVILAVLGLPDDRQTGISSVPSVTETVPVKQKRPDAEPEQAKARFTQPELEVQPVPEVPLVVDSFAPTRHVPLEIWTRANTIAGHFDSVSLMDNNGGSGAANGRTVDGDAMLVASGWSGDPHLGLLLHDVVISQCDRLVARARVVLERPDVADVVHPNLGRSGWEAILHASDLAICADSVLRAWVVLPGKPATLLPLNGVHRIGSVEPAADTAYHVSALPPIEPGDIAPPDISSIDVTASRVNLRQCAGTHCPRVGQVAGGGHRVHIASRYDGWSLLVFKDRAGWMSDTLYMPVP